MSPEPEAGGPAPASAPAARSGSREELDEVVAALCELLPHGSRRDAPLGPLTTYRVGGPARLLVEVVDPASLTTIASVVAGTGVEVLVVGNGSNLLVSDSGFAGIALRLGAGFETVIIDGTVVEAGGAAPLPVVARRTAAAGLTGFEWAVGVPGTIGGAVRMNAGGHGSDMASVVRGVHVVDLATGEDRAVDVADLELGYRSSSITPSQVVVSATLALEVDRAGTAAATVADVVRWRRAHQPGGPNAGSVFTNPPDDSAGRLIEAAGLKGLRVGTAEVSTKHANFIQADPGGRADDVHALMVRVRDGVERSTGVRLHPETRLVGFGEEPWA